MTAPALVEAGDVTVIRGGREVLRGLNVRIEGGEHLAILGPNGCGKSTFLKLLTRECYPVVRDGSYLRILGRERWNIFELRTLLGIVSSDLATACALHVSGRDAVLSGFFSSLGLAPHHAVTPVMEERAAEALERLDARYLWNRSMTAMSSGEARRVLIARALAHRPATLVFDEPSTSLDLAAQRELREELRRLAGAGIGIVIVTHHLSDVIPEIQRVALMQQGRIICDGPRSEVLTQANLQALFGVPVRMVSDGDSVHAW